MLFAGVIFCTLDGTIVAAKQETNSYHGNRKNQFSKYANGAEQHGPNDGWK
jgi:hypothetical protein